MTVRVAGMTVRVVGMTVRVVGMTVRVAGMMGGFEEGFGRGGGFVLC